jgi:sulfite exporter TauE/SafE
MPNLFVIFGTGLLTGGLTCLAVQGGLLTTAMAQEEEEQQENERHEPRRPSAMPIIWFLGAKLVAYTILGFLLGLLGSALELSVAASVTLQFAVIIFMLGTAGNLLNIHPIFRYFIIQPPRFLTRHVRSQAKSKSIFAPAILGALTIFIPCGTTQAMMALAISSGKAFSGMAILFAFILGTTPLFFLLGYFVTKMGDAMQKKFYKFAGFAIIFLALFSLNGTLALAGLPNFSSVWESLSKPAYFVEPIPSPAGGPGSTGSIKETDNNPTIKIGSYGYSPQTLYVKRGEPVKITLTNADGYSCAQSFVIPSLGLRASVPPGRTEVLEFVAPSEPTTIPFMCSMGMYRGQIIVR